MWIRNAPRRGPVPWLTKYRCFPPEPGGVCGHRRSSSSGDSAIRRWALWSCVPRSARFALEASSSQPLGPRGPINDQGERVARPVPIVSPCTMDSWIHPEFATIEKSCLRPCLVAGRESATPAPCAKAEDVSVFAFQRDRLIVAIIYVRAALMLYEIGVTARVDLLRSSYRSFRSYGRSWFNNHACCCCFMVFKEK